MGGSVTMVEDTLKLAYGENSDLIKDKRIAAVQALSGTGACRLFADFQKRFSPDSQIYIPVPTWAKLVLVSLLFCFCSCVRNMHEFIIFLISPYKILFCLIHDSILASNSSLFIIHSWFTVRFWQSSQHLERCPCPSENIPLLSSRIEGFGLC